MHNVVVDDSRYSNWLKSKYDRETDRFTVVDMSKCYCELLRNVYIDTPDDTYLIITVSTQQLVCHNCVTPCPSCQTMVCKNKLTSCKICRRIICEFCCIEGCICDKCDIFDII
jgi:hypothetical protein